MRMALIAAMLMAGTSVQAGKATCKASYYGRAFHEKPTASGEIFDMHGFTAAHQSLPFGTKVKVSRGKRSVEVRITDRGPFVAGRCIDLSRAAAEKLGMIRVGVDTVTLTW